MKILSTIENGQINEKILRPLGVSARPYLPREYGWETRNHDPPPKNPHMSLKLPAMIRICPGKSNE
jgi:hypothetical protein